MDAIRKKLLAEILKPASERPADIMAWTPETLALASQLDTLSDQIRNFETAFNEHHKLLLSSVKDKLKSLPERVVDAIRSSLEANGVQVVSNDGMRNVIDTETAVTVRDEIRIKAEGNTSATIPECVANARPSSSETNGVVQTKAERSNSVPATCHSFIEPSWPLYKWSGGSEQLFPEDFTLPKCSVSCLWDLWYFGKQGENGAPYRKLRSHHLTSGTENEIRTQRSYLSRGKRVMEAIAECAITSGAVSQAMDLNTVEYATSRSLFEKHFLLLCIKSYGIKSETTADQLRINEIKYLTFYDVLTRTNRKKRTFEEV